MSAHFMSQVEEDEGDICGIIEADGLTLKEVPIESKNTSSAWRASILIVQEPRAAVVEDEDGDLEVPRTCTKPIKSHLDSHDQGFHSLLGSRILLQRLSTSTIENVGFQLWAGALVLSDFMLARPCVIKGRRVCELGAGLGLCSILASRLGATSVLCSDGNPNVVQNCCEILRDNECTGNVRASLLKWENPPSKPWHDNGSHERMQRSDAVDCDNAVYHDAADLWRAEILLAADVLYDPPGAEALALLSALLLKEGAAEAMYMSVEKRIYFSAATLQPEVAAYPQFLDDSRRHGLVIENINLSEIPVYFGYVRSRFYELVKLTATKDTHITGISAKKRKTN